MTAISACSAFATISGYVALFHTAALMTANLVVVVASSAIPAVAFAATSGVVRAVCAFTVVLVVNMAVPFRHSDHRADPGLAKTVTCCSKGRTCYRSWYSNISL